MRLFKGIRRKLRNEGIYLRAEEAQILARAIQRPRPVVVTEPGADVVARFLRYCEELER